jgi:chromosome segregation ATPase
MKPGEISLDYISRRLDDLQREATHNRQVSDFILKQVKALQAEFDAQRAHLTLIDGRLDRIDARLGRMDGRLDTLEAKLDQVLQKLS